MQTYSDAYQHVKNGHWKDFFVTQDQLESVTELLDTLSSLNASGSTDSVTIYPKPERVFRVFGTKPEDIKVVILGQDPYHTLGKANDLAFSLTDPHDRTPSLKNIFNELYFDDVARPDGPRTNADLSDWAEQGVFLLNTALTVKKGQANSQKLLWKQMTRDLIQYLNKLPQPIVFILWGGNAAQYVDLLDNTDHLVLISSHPSPLGARKQLGHYPKFVGSKPFSKANDFLSQDRAIKWQ